MLTAAVIVMAVLLLLAGCTEGFEDDDWSVLSPACRGAGGDPGHCADLIEALEAKGCTVNEALDAIPLLATAESSALTNLGGLCEG